MPRSNSQTSPRRGGILTLIQESEIQESEQGATRVADFLIGQRAGIDRELSRAPQDFYLERLFVAGRQSFECFE